MGTLSIKQLIAQPLTLDQFRATCVAQAAFLSILEREGCLNTKVAEEDAVDLLSYALEAVRFAADSGHPIGRE